MEAAQEIILEKRTRWAKTKRAPHVLLSGLLRCGRCGAAVYARASAAHGYYYCSSASPAAAPGAAREACSRTPQTWRWSASHPVELLDASFLRTVFGRFQFAQPARDQNADKLDRQREALEKERQQLLT